MAIAPESAPKIAQRGRPSPIRIAFWLACLLSALVIATLSQAILFDGDPPEDADLLPEPRPPLPAALNGVEAMERLVKDLPRTASSLQLGTSEVRMINDEVVDLRDLTEAEFFERMSDIVELEWRRVKGRRDWSLCLEAVQQRAAGLVAALEVENPVGWALLAIACERRLFETRDSARNLNFDFLGEREFYRALRTVVSQAPDEDAHELLRRLRTLPDPEAALVPVLKRVYAAHRRYLSKREQTRNFKPNRTLSAVAGEWLIWIDEIDGAWQDRGSARLRKFRGPRRLMRFLSGNGRGDGWWLRERARYFAFEQNLALVRFDRRSTELALALEIHRREHGAFPEQLESLTPGILERIPLDPFSGQSFIYDAARGVIRSVGTDPQARRAPGLPRDPIDPEDPVVVTADWFPESSFRESSSGGR